MKYIKQNDNHSCGPVAIFNILRWSGMNVKKEHYRWIIHRLKTEHELFTYDLFGTTEWAFNETLRYLAKDKFSVRKTYKKVNAKWLADNLNNGAAVAMMYVTKGGGLHFSLAIGMDGNNFIMVNDDPRIKKVILKRKWKTVEGHLSRRIENYPILWVLKRYDK